MYDKSKLKFASSESDQSSDGGDDSGPDDLGLSLDKLTLGPKKKLLVLCFGGLLVHRVHERDMATVRGLRPDVVYGRFLVFKRPFCTEFLKFCFERFDVALWSAAREHNIGSVLSNITGGSNSKFLFVWNQEDCIETSFHCPENEQKRIFLKELKKIWESRYYKGYSAKNTLLIDHDPRTCLVNPPNTAIFPKPYKKHDVNDTYFGPGGELRKYLDAIADVEDVPSYVKDHPIGQPAITSAHPDWGYYSKVVRKYGKKGDAAAESSKK